RNVRSAATALALEGGGAGRLLVEAALGLGLVAAGLPQEVVGPLPVLVDRLPERLVLVARTLVGRVGIGAGRRVGVAGPAIGLVAHGWLLGGRLVWRSAPELPDPRSTENPRPTGNAGLGAGPPAPTARWRRA